jgi:hypothetical protein
MDDPPVCAGNLMREGGRINDCAFDAVWVVLGADMHPDTLEPFTLLLGSCELHKAAVSNWVANPMQPAIVAEVAALPMILETLWSDGADVYIGERVPA